MCSHLFGGTGFLGLGHGGWVHAVEDLGGIAATAFLGPVVGTALGVGDIAGAGLVGAGVGALKGAVQGGNPLVGALEGGAISAGLAGVGDALGGGGASGAATGSPAVGGAGASAAGAAAPASVGADLPLGINPDTGAPVFSPANVAAATTGPGFGAAPDTGGAVFAPAGGAAGAVSPAPAIAGFGDVPAAGAGDTSGLAGTSDAIGTGAGSAGATADFNPSFGSAATQAAGVYPVPPVPPALDASGNAISGAYPTLGAAQAASEANAITTAGGIVPQETGLGAVTQALTPGTPAAGTLGYQIDPSLGSNPYTPAGAGPGGTYTLAQGASSGAPASPGFLANVGSGNITGAVGNVGSAIGNNPALALGGALLGYDVLKGNQVPKGYNAINTEATQLGQQATQLEGYLTSGTLPPGVATALQQAASSAKAAIRSQYAARGESGSSAEQADLANVDNTVVSQGASIATNLLNSGVNEAGLASQLYGQIMNYSLQSDAQLTQALSVLAAASARPTTVTLAGTNS